MPRLFHDTDDTVETDAVLAVGEGGVEVGIEGSGGSEGVALDAGNLHESADGVAGHAEVVLESHLCGVLDLCHRASEELAGGSRGHGTGHADFALAAYVGTADAGVVLDEVADEASGGESVKDTFFREGVVV